MCGNVRYCCFFEEWYFEWYCAVYSQKNNCVVVALKVSYYRITYRITVLPYYCITGSLVTTSYGLLQLVTVVIACYRLLPLVTACYRLL